jgi:outer membrane biosynthesis protein TonB
MAKFKQGNFNDWISSQLNNYPEVKSKARKYTITYSFIIGKNGKVRDGHVIKGTDYPEINAAYEKILTQIPDWEPAKRGGESVSVYNHIMSGGTVVTEVIKK